MGCSQSQNQHDQAPMEVRNEHFLKVLLTRIPIEGGCIQQYHVIEVVWGSAIFPISWDFAIAEYHVQDSAVSLMMRRFLMPARRPPMRYDQDRFESKSFDRECIKFFDLDLHLTVLTIPHSIKRFNQPLDDAVYHESLIAENAEPTIYTPHDQEYQHEYIRAYLEIFAKLELKSRNMKATVGILDIPLPCYSLGMDPLLSVLVACSAFSSWLKTKRSPSNIKRIQFIAETIQQAKIYAQAVQQFYSFAQGHSDELLENFAACWQADDQLRWRSIVNLADEFRDNLNEPDLDSLLSQDSFISRLNEKIRQGENKNLEIAQEQEERKSQITEQYQLSDFQTNMINFWANHSNGIRIIENKNSEIAQDQDERKSQITEQYQLSQIQINPKNRTDLPYFRSDIDFQANVINYLVVNNPRNLNCLCLKPLSLTKHRLSFCSYCRQSVPAFMNCKSCTRSFCASCKWPGIIDNCTKNHKLEFATYQLNFTCDSCGRDQPQLMRENRGLRMLRWQCRICDLDICYRCKLHRYGERVDRRVMAQLKMLRSTQLPPRIICDMFTTMMITAEFQMPEPEMEPEFE